MADSADVLVGVIVVVAIFLLIFTPLGDFLVGFFDRADPQEYWFANVYAVPIGTGTVSPSGNVSVAFGLPLSVEAVAKEGYYFLEWRVDEMFFSSQPIIEIPSENPNVTINVCAVFDVDVETFEIDAGNGGYFVSGSHNIYTPFKLINNGDADITNIKLKLNDPYDLFSSFTVAYTKTSQVSTHWLLYESVLNKWQSHYIYFGSAISYVNPRSVMANSDSTFYAGTIDVKTVESGTYLLSWEISFSVLSGSFSEPPSLIIPWEVTIY